MDGGSLDVHDTTGQGRQVRRDRPGQDRARPDRPEQDTRGGSPITSTNNPERFWWGGGGMKHAITHSSIAWQHQQTARLQRAARFCLV